MFILFILWKEIKRNLVLFLLAGYETTSTTLLFTLYTLATNPDEQETLRDEIDQHFGNEDVSFKKPI